MNPTPLQIALLVGLTLQGFVAAGAEPTNSSAATNDSREAALRARVLAQTQTNAPESTVERTPTSAPAGTNAAPGRADYATFRTIPDRNIFDPNRTPRRPGGARPRPRTTESFGLVGIMSYDKGTFAFFSGSSSSYRKVLKPTEAIAGYTVTDIEPNAVKLASGTNEVELRMGMSLRREEGGEWLVSTQASSSAGSASVATSAASATPPAGGSQPSAAAGGELSDIEKRMMQRREQQ